MFRIVLMVLALLTGGCSPSIVAPVKKEIARVETEAADLLSKGQRPLPIDRDAMSRIEHVRSAYLPAGKLTEAGIKRRRTAALNQDFETRRTFSGIQVVAERVTQLPGIPTVVSPDALTGSATTGAPGVTVGAGASGVQVGGTPNLPPGAHLPPAPGGAAQSVIPGQVGPMASIYLEYSGSLAGFLDIVAARYGVSWEWTGTEIRFFRLVTRTFRVVGLAGDINVNSKISNHTGGGATTATGSTSSSTQEMSVAMSSMSVWRAIDESIKTMLTTVGKVAVTSATGTVTVTDTPQVVAMVEKFINEQNTSLSRQVVVNVRVLAVSLKDDDNYGINWSAVYNSLSGNIGWSWKNAFAANQAASALTLKVLSTAGSDSSDIKAWRGTEAVINALSTQGQVSQVTSANLITINNQPVPLQVGQQRFYLASTTTTITPNVGATTTLVPGLVTTGFAMNMVPHMLDNVRLALQYSIDISSLVDLSAVSSNGSTIQTPVIDTRNFLERVMLNSGDVLVVAGFEQVSASSDLQGIGKATNVALGGAVKGSRERKVLVILIQPVIAES